MAIGRKKKFQSVEELQTLAEEYFDRCEMNEVPLTFEGLAKHLGVCRKTVFNYKNQDEFRPIFERFKDIVLADLMEKGLMGEINSTFGIFCLKNYGYTDKQEVETVNTNLNKNVELSGLTDEQIDRILNEE